jgi:predicted O-methyltransferase YrrM
MRVTRSKFRWTLEGLFQGIARPTLLARQLQQIYGEVAQSKSRVPVKTLAQFLETERLPEVRMLDFLPRNKNISITEMSFICSIARSKKPATVLELGTFDGNTTLQIAENCPDETLIFTVDMPRTRDAPGAPEGAARRRFRGSRHEARIHEIFGDTRTLDFAGLCGGRAPDLVFIDAGHSYECVRNDTEKSLKVIAPGAVVLWHDYAYNCAGVFNYLNEIAADLAICNLEGTSLVAWRPIPAV